MVILQLVQLVLISEGVCKNVEFHFVALKIVSTSGNTKFSVGTNVYCIWQFNWLLV